MSPFASVIFVLIFAGLVAGIVIGSIALSRANSASLVTLDATQTLTNKTLTSPSFFHLKSVSPTPAVASGTPFTSGRVTSTSTDTSGTIIASLTVSTNPTTASFTVLFSQEYTTVPGTVIVMTPKIPGYNVPREVTVSWSKTSFTITEIFSAVFLEIDAEMYHYIVV